MSQRASKTGVGVAGTVMAVLLGACFGASVDTSTTAASSASAPAPPSAALPDGETFAWVRGVAGDDLLVDPATLLTGDAAREAAVAAGVISHGEELANDFFIDDPDDRTASVPLAAEAELALLLFQEGSPIETSVGSDEFVSALEGANPDVYGVVEGVLPAMVTIEGGAVTRVIQFYLP